MHGFETDAFYHYFPVSELLVDAVCAYLVVVITGLFIGFCPFISFPSFVHLYLKFFICLTFLLVLSFL